MTDLSLILDAIGQLDDAEIDLADAALQLARRAAPEGDLHEARAHLSLMARAAAALASDLDILDLPGCAAMLSRLLAEEFGYRGDSETYDDLDNANLIRVIERRRGLPVALGIIWLHAARATGWEAFGINFPGHFLVGLGAGNHQVVLDVFDGGRIMSIEDLRKILRRVHGKRVALRREMLAPMTNRDILLRLHGNIRSRQELRGQSHAALITLRDMLRIAPEEPHLWLEAAVLHQQHDEIAATLDCFDRFLALVPEGAAAERVRGEARELRGRMN